MASIVNRPGGHKWIQFKGLTGRRQTIRLGKVSARVAADFRRRVEYLLAAQAMGQPPDLDTAKWAGGLAPTLHARLAAAGLVAGRAVATVEHLISEFDASLAVGASTRHNLHVVYGNLRRFFGASCVLGSITPADAQTFRTWMGREGGHHGGPLAEATVSRRVRRAKQIFTFAVQKQWLLADPFRGIAQWNEVNRSRDFFVSDDLIGRILAQIPAAEFRAVVALARYGGLRCPSEIHPLEWGAVNWEHQSLRVVSPKTKYHPRQEVRTVPLFPELQDALSALWELAPDGQVTMFPGSQITGAALTGRLSVACRAADIVLWPRPWQNMRATRETELLEEFPMHVVAAWLGHSPKVALQHYAQIAKEHHTRAVKLGKSVLRLSSRPPKVKQNPKHRSVP